MQNRFVSIWFPHLATDWFTLRQPRLKNIPFVLRANVHGRMVITHSNPLALSKGIDQGMVLADARAIYPTLEAFDDKPGLTGQLLQRIAEWCIRFTPVAAIDLPEGIILDATGCSHLWGSDEAYLTSILTRLLSRGYQARASMADTIGAAWAMARFGTGEQMNGLLSFPPEALRLGEETIKRLHKLGLSRVRDLMTMPASAIRRRFGTEMVQRLHQALGKEEEFIQPISIIESYQERLPCPEPIVRIEGIEIALQRLLERLCARLIKEGKGIRTAIFRGYRVDNKTFGIQIGTNCPSNNLTHLFHLFQMKLSTIEPDLGIELFILEASKVEDHLPVQEEFWKDAAGLYDTRLSELIDRLSGRMGADVIHRYLPDQHYWPERSIKMARSITDQPATAWRMERSRPMQLLERPQPIEVMAPVPDYPPMIFRYKGKLHKIIKSDGPERIEQEWWIEEGQHRDYYAVEDEEGCRYWLFRLGHYDVEKTYGWFIHGVFA